MTGNRTVSLVHRKRTILQKSLGLLAIVLFVGIGIDLRWVSGLLSGEPRVSSSLFSKVFGSEHAVLIYFVCATVAIVLLGLSVAMDEPHRRKAMNDKLNRFNLKFPSQAERDQKISEVYPRAEKPPFMSEQKYIEQAILRWSLLEGDTDVRA